MRPVRSSYVNGPIGGTMVRTAFSMLAGTIALQGYNLADTFFVSQLGKNQLAAMALTFPAVMLIGCIYRGICVGMMAPVAQALGGNKRRKAARLVTSGLILLMIASVTIGTLGAMLVRPTFALMGAEGDVLTYVIQYMLIWYMGSFTGSMSLAGNDLLIASGDSFAASMMMVAGMTINVVLDPFMIYGWLFFPEMGVAGAALATVISQAVCGMFALRLLHRRHRLIAPPRIPWQKLVGVWKVITGYAIPSIMGMLLMPAGSFVITWIVGRFGTEALAAVGAASRLEGLAFIFPMAIGMALMPMVAQNYGAAKFERINQCRRFAMRFAGGFLMVMAGVYFVTAPWVVTWFSKDPEVQRIMILYMRIVPWGFAAVEMHRFAGFFYTGTGRPVIAALLNALRVVVFLVPLSLLALHYNSLAGVFWARLIADLVSAAIACYAAMRLTRRLADIPYRKLRRTPAELKADVVAESIEPEL